MNRNAMIIDRPEMPRERGGRQGGRDNLALAMAYVPMQCLQNLYSPEDALLKGTLFPELDKPFAGRRGGGMNG